MIYHLTRFQQDAKQMLVLIKICWSNRNYGHLFNKFIPTTLCERWHFEMPWQNYTFRTANTFGMCCCLRRILVPVSRYSLELCTCASVVSLAHRVSDHINFIWMMMIRNRCLLKNKKEEAYNRLYYYALIQLL